MYYLFTVAFYSAAKKNEFVKIFGKWTELGNIVK